MAVRIKFDENHCAINPILVLMNRNANRIGTIPYYDLRVKPNLNSYSELSFTVDKNNCNPNVWNNLTDFKLVWIRDWNMCFEVYVDTNEDNTTIKKITANSLGESELSQINLYNIEINTETDISRDDYVPTVLFNSQNHNASLLHRILEKCPHYTINHVDSSIANIQRTFTFSNQSIYDSFMQIATEIGCIFRINCSLNSSGILVREINVYDLEYACLSCGYREENNFQTCPKCGGTNITDGYGEDTTIFVSSENLAEQINFTTDTGSVKNCFKLIAGDELMNSAIISCNPNGGQYLWYFSQEMRDDMSSELVTKIDQYWTLCDYYQHEYSISLSNSLVTQYNTLIQKYSVYTNRFNTITSPIVGSSSLTENLYNVLDFNIYLNDELMPTSQISDTTAAIQAQKLTAANLSPVSVTDLSSLSLSTANNAVLGMARVIIDNRYQVSIVSSTLSNNTWQGSFNVTNYSDDDDTATSNTVSVVINDNYEIFLKQKIDKALQKSMTTTDTIDIVSLFKLNLSDFNAEIKKFSLSHLRSFYDNCETCLDVLIEQGIANSNTWSGQNPNLYNDLYIPYRNKHTSLEQEIKTRETEIKIVEKIKNTLAKNQDTIQSNLNLSSFLGLTLWKELSSYRREDTYQNENYISDGLSNTEILNNANAFIKEAQNEIYKSANMQHSISTSLKNLLLIKEFEPILDYFELGNWIRIKVESKIYKLRLISYEINFNDDSQNNISVEFSDIIKMSDGVSDIQSILSQSQSMSSSYGSVTRQAKSGNEGNNKVNKWINDGIALNNIKILEDAENQNIQFDNNGILCREYLPLLDDYDDRQLKIINKGVFLSDNKWQTAKVGIGEISYNNQLYYGVNAQVLIGDLLMGNQLKILDSEGREIMSVAEDIVMSVTDSTVGFVNKNVLEITGTTQTKSGLTFTVNKTAGTVKVNGTCNNSENGYETFVVGSITNSGSKAVNYYLSGCYNGGATDKYYLYAWDATTSARPKQWDGTTQSLSSFGITDSVQIQVPVGHTVQIRILVRDGQTLTNAMFYPMVRSGSISDSTFEPYKATMKDYSDTQLSITAGEIRSEVSSTLANYSTTTQMNSAIEQKANEISLAVTKSTIGYAGKNLLPINRSTTTVSGVTFTINKTAGTIKLSGTADEDFGFGLAIPSNVYGNLYLSGCAANGSTSTYYMYVYDNDMSARCKKWDGTTAMSTLLNNTSSVEVQVVKGHSSTVFIQCKSGVTYNNITFKPMIRYGSIIDSTFEPYTQTPNEYTDAQITITDTQIRSDVSSTYSTKTEATNKANSARDAAIADTDTKLLSYSTTTQMNSAINQKADSISLAVSQLTYGEHTRNLIPFVLGTSGATVNGITCKRAGTGFKLTGTATDNAYFTVYTTNASVAFNNDKLPNVKTLSNGTYIVSGGKSGGVVSGFSNDIQYRIQYSTDGTNDTQQKIVYFGESGDTTEKTFTITSDMPYIRHYIWVRSGTSIGASGIYVYPMIRDSSITSSAYSAGIDNGKYMCSAISMTPEKIELSAGRLIITAGNFQLDSNGIVTMTGGVIKTSNYAAASGNTKTVGGKINLSATGSTLLFDTANFKIRGDGGVTATSANLNNCTINGGSFVVDAHSQESYICLKDTSGGSSNTYETEVNPGEIYLRNAGSMTTITSVQIVSKNVIASNSVSTKILTVGTIEDTPASGTILAQNHIRGGSFRLGAFPNNNVLNVVDWTIRENTIKAVYLGINDTSNNGYGVLPMRINSSWVYIAGDLDFYNSGTGVKLHNAWAFRWYDSAVYCGVMGQPLKLVGSVIYANDSPVATTSDERVKVNITEPDNKYLELIKELPPRTFNYNEDISLSGRTHSGYIAQELKSAIDKVGLTTKEVAAFVDLFGDDKEYAIRYEELIPLLHCWIKEHESRLNKLEGKE